MLKNQNGLRQSVIIMRERAGRSLTLVGKVEAADVAVVAARVDTAATIRADEGSHWDALHGRYTAHRINHSICYSAGTACTNMAESYFNRLRRAEIGTHHSMAGAYFAAYASAMAWREDNRRVDNGTQVTMVVGAAMASSVSRQWKGYWQRVA